MPDKSRQLWVRCNSVYGKSRKVIRRLALYEVFGIWDYKGKLESKGWEASDALLNTGSWTPRWIPV